MEEEGEGLSLGDELDLCDDVTSTTSELSMHNRGAATGELNNNGMTMM